MEEGSPVFAVMRKKDLPTPYAPSISGKCSGCNEDVWVTNSMLTIMPKNAKILCLACIKQLEEKLRKQLEEQK